MRISLFPSFQCADDHLLESLPPHLQWKHSTHAISQFPRMAQVRHGHH